MKVLSVMKMSTFVLSTLVVGFSIQARAELTSPDFCHEQCPVSSEVFGEKLVEDETIAISLYIDNDILTGGLSDRDYTGGFAFSFSGSNAARHPFSIDKGIDFINEALGIDTLTENSDYTLSSCEVGLTAFTPTDKITRQPIQDDRPYASLLYISNTQQHILKASRISWISTLTFGALGLDVSRDLQNSIHQLIGSDNADGWDNQISNGGEPTFRYSLTRQRYHRTNIRNFHLTSSAKISVGYITEASIGSSFRWGRLRTPWWSFNADPGRYSEKGNVELPTSSYVDELYFLAGANVKLRAYNAFLQGQFRDSNVTYSSSEIEHVVYEGWIGVACAFKSGFRLSYIMRRQSSEIKVGQGNRAFSYGGLILSYKY